MNKFKINDRVIVCNNYNWYGALKGYIFSISKLNFKPLYIVEFDYSNINFFHTNNRVRGVYKENFRFYSFAGKYLKRINDE